MSLRPSPGERATKLRRAIGRRLTSSPGRSEAIRRRTIVLLEEGLVCCLPALGRKAMRVHPLDQYLVDGRVALQKRKRFEDELLQRHRARIGRLSRAAERRLNIRGHDLDHAHGGIPELKAQALRVRMQGGFRGAVGWIERF